MPQTSDLQEELKTRTENIQRKKGEWEWKQGKTTAQTLFASKCDSFSKFLYYGIIFQECFKVDLQRKAVWMYRLLEVDV